MVALVACYTAASLIELGAGIRDRHTGDTIVTEYPSERALKTHHIVPIPNRTPGINWLLVRRDIAFAIRQSVALVTGQAEPVKHVVCSAIVAHRSAFSIGAKVSSASTLQAAILFPFCAQGVVGWLKFRIYDACALIYNIPSIAGFALPIFQPSVAQVTHGGTDAFL